MSGGWHNHPIGSLGKHIMLSMCIRPAGRPELTPILGVSGFRLLVRIAPAQMARDKWPSITTPKWVWLPPIGVAHAADWAEGNLPPWGISPFGANTIQYRFFCSLENQQSFLLLLILIQKIRNYQNKLMIF